jgi:TorA maturation chaperone TorD
VERFDRACKSLRKTTDPSSEHPERHDRISLEVEFMALLIGPDAQSSFVKDHLAWWIGAFAKLLAKEHPDGLHAAVAAVLAVLIPAERTLLRVEAPHKRVAPSHMEQPEECEGCLLQM